MAYYGFKPAEQAIQIGDNTIVSADIADGSIVNADLNSSAAIAMSKTQLAAGTGITLATNTLNVDAAQTQITSVGTLSSLTLGGDLLVPQYIKHVGDTDCHIEFGTDEIKLRTGNSSRLIARDANVEIYPALVATSATFSDSIVVTGADTRQVQIQDTSSDGQAKLQFTNDATSTTMGLFGNDSDKFKIYHDSTWALTFGSGGSATFASKITVDNDAAEHLTLKRNGSHWWDIQVGSNGNLNIQKNGAADTIIVEPDGTTVFAGNGNFSGVLECGGAVTGVTADSGANDLIVGNTSGEAGMSIICNTDSSTMIDFREEGESSGVKGRILYDHSANNRMQLWSGGSATLTLDGSSNATFAGKIDAPGQWELIAIDKLSSDGMIIQNNTCFSSDNYIMFKLVIGWIGFNGGDDLYFRWIENGSETTASDYFGGTDIATHGSTTREHKAFSGLDNVPIFEDPWNDLAGGVHGEMQIYNATAPTVDGLNTDRGQNYRPWFHANLFGYDGSGGDAGYGMQETWARFNTNMNPENIDGYKIYTVNNNLEAKSHIFVYGLRTA